MKSHEVLLLGISLIVMQSCRSASSPSQSVRVIASEARQGALSLESPSAAQRIASRSLFEVPVRVENNTSGEILYLRCGTSLQKRIGAAWERVHQSVCSLVAGPLSDPIRIAPGAVLEFMLAVDHLTGPTLSGASIAAGPMAGSYRVRTSLVEPDGKVIGEPANISNEFIVP